MTTHLKMILKLQTLMYDCFLIWFPLLLRTNRQKSPYFVHPSGILSVLLLSRNHQREINVQKESCTYCILVSRKRGPL